MEILEARALLAGDVIYALDLGDNQRGDSAASNPPAVHQNVVGSALTRGPGADYGLTMWDNNVGGLTVRGGTVDATHFLSNHLATEQAAIADNAFFEWTVAPTANHELSIDNVTFNVFLQYTPSVSEAAVGLYYLNDAGAPVRVGDVQRFGSKAATVTVDASGVTELQNLDGPVRFRIYGWNGNNQYSDKGIGTRVRVGSAAGNDLIVTGTVVYIPAIRANGDSYTVNEDKLLSVSSALGVLSNDTDPENDSLSAKVVSDPLHGVLQLNSDGSLAYTPDANFHGSDFFTYVANDGTADSNLATVAIIVRSVNDVPVANADGPIGVSMDAVNVAIDVLSNDSDADGDDLSIFYVGRGVGVAAISSDNKLDYTPKAGFRGEDSITYVVADGQGGFNWAVVTIIVADPIAADDTVNITFGQPHVFAPEQLLGNDSDPDGDDLTIIAVADLHGGTAEIRDGLVWFTPAPHIPGQQASMSGQFAYAVSDGNGGTSVATVNVIQGSSPHANPSDSIRLAEHNALFLKVTSRADATAIAVRSGRWSDPSIWHHGVLPQAGDRVLIHQSIEVVYDQVSDVAYDWIRNDGTLTVAHDVDTRLVAETIASAPGSTFNLGTDAHPIAANVTAEILIDTTGGPIDIEHDPTLVSRGLIVHGMTSIYGADKKDFTGLAGNASAGDTFIELSDAELPAGWRVGDTLLLVGTFTDTSLMPSEYVSADANNDRFHDELLEITSIEQVGDRIQVRFNNRTNDAAVAAGLKTLLWNHTRPEGDTFNASELTINVANLTRNVVVRSSDPKVDTQQRGHFMVMHSPSASVRNAQFKDLGRTDKTKLVDDPPAVGNSDGTPAFGTNPRGRYGLHLHRVGANSLTGTAVEVVGNVVWGTPGWGIVQHDSHANLIDNVVFDVAGAGIVAEDGNELGLWKNNLSVKAKGNGVDDFDDGIFLHSKRGPLFDLGFTGSAYWLQGGGFGVRLEGNIAASSNTGIDIVHHIDLLANVERISVNLIADPVVRQAYIDAGISEVTPNNAPTRGIDGLVVYNARRGIHTWLHNRDSLDFEGRVIDADLNAQAFPSHIDHYVLWNVRQGIHNFYSAQFVFRHGLIIGDTKDPVDFVPAGDAQGNNSLGTGVSSNAGDAHDLHFDGLRVEGFEYAFQITHAEPDLDPMGEPVPFAASSLRNAQFANVDFAFLPMANYRLVPFSDLFVLEDLTAVTNRSDGNVAPTAQFTFELQDGGIIPLDASSSVDPDPGPRVAPGSDGIVAFAWDFDGDGDFNDAFGQQARGRLPAPGANQVSLKVWDDHGQSAIRTIQIDVVDTTYQDAFIQALNPRSVFGGGTRGSVSRDSGWQSSGFIYDVDGIMRPQPNTLTDWRRLGQVVRDDHLRVGNQTLAFEMMNVEGDGYPNIISVTLFGINGEWQDFGSQQADPRGIGAVVAQVDRLLQLELGGQSFAPQAFSFEVDLGSSGYEYLYVSFDNAATRTALGDDFGIRNISLVGGWQPPTSQSVLGGPESGIQPAALDGQSWLIEDLSGDRAGLDSVDSSIVALEFDAARAVLLTAITQQLGDQQQLADEADVVDSVIDALLAENADHQLTAEDLDLLFAAYD